MRFPVKLSVLCFALAITIWSCSKPADDPANPNPPTPPPVVVTNTAKPTGVLYINCTDTFLKMNTADTSFIWKMPNLNYAGSSGNVMVFDSTRFYFPSTGLQYAYSTQTGRPLWNFITRGTFFAPDHPYREASLLGDYAYLTSSSDVFTGSANLYCVDKRTGVLRWQKKIDQGDVDVSFSALALATGDRVVTLTRDNNNHRHLAAFSATDGTQLWMTGVNDTIPYMLRLYNGKVYSTTGSRVMCYDPADGSLKWQTYALGNQPSTYTAFDGNRMIVSKFENNIFNFITINTDNGNVIKISTIVLPSTNSALNCNYRDNTIAYTYHYTADTIGIGLYNLATGVTKWQGHFPESSFANYYIQPLLTDKYLIFPIYPHFPEGKMSMYFYDLDGFFVQNIPFRNQYASGSVYGFAYVENGTVYTQTTPF